jgi:hypothetical protein
MLFPDEKHIHWTFGSGVCAPQDTPYKLAWEARWRDGFIRTVKCAFCPDWPGATGDGPTTREALAEHRLENHHV